MSNNHKRKKKRKKEQNENLSNQLKSKPEKSSIINHQSSDSQKAEITYVRYLVLS